MDATKTSDGKAAAVLASLGVVRHISVFGRALLDHGVFSPQHERKRHSAQGLALLAGKWLARLEMRGLAVCGTDGWRVTNGVRTLSGSSSKTEVPSGARDDDLHD